jgi:hypothetical protein
VRECPRTPPDDPRVGACRHLDGETGRWRNWPPRPPGNQRTPPSPRRDTPANAGIRYSRTLVPARTTLRAGNAALRISGDKSCACPANVSYVSVLMETRDQDNPDDPISTNTVENSRLSPHCPKRVLKSGGRRRVGSHSRNLLPRPFFNSWVADTPPSTACTTDYQPPQSGRPCFCSAGSLPVPPHIGFSPGRRPLG